MEYNIMGTTFTNRLKYQPVRHTCGHFEARLMAPQPVEFSQAGSECSMCNAQGRPVQTNFPDLATVQTHCKYANEAAGR
jgi:hypothetical protein